MPSKLMLLILLSANWQNMLKSIKWYKVQHDTVSTNVSMNYTVDSVVKLDLKNLSRVLSKNTQITVVSSYAHNLQRLLRALIVDQFDISHGAFHSSALTSVAIHPLLRLSPGIWPLGLWQSLSVVLFMSAAQLDFGRTII